MTTTGAPGVLAGQYVRFPPKWRNILVPAAPRRACALGMTLYTASRPQPLLAQRALWLVAGTRLVPGARESWVPPFERDVFEALWKQWERLAGAADGIAVYARLQSARAALVLLYCAGRRSMLVRVRSDPESLELERRVSELASRRAPRTFRVPALRGRGHAAGWHWTAYELMSTRPHRPAGSVPSAAEIAGLVEALVPRPDGTPTHWRGAHRDIAPWNLRRAGRDTWLIDWEDAGWAPPGADEVYLAVTRAALRPAEPDAALPVPPEHLEARSYWAAVTAARVPAEGEEQLHRRMHVLLGAGRVER